MEDIIRAKPDSNQRAILNSVAQYPMTSVRSGHGIGKSAVESWLAIWFLTTRPFPKIPCTFFSNATSSRSSSFSFLSLSSSLCGLIFFSVFPYVAVYHAFTFT